MPNWKLSANSVFSLMILTLTILLGALALASLHLSKSAEQNYPPIGSFVEIDGQSIHYRETGDSTANDTIVLIHGASTSLLDFESSLRPMLEERYRVIAIDRPGHGYSSRTDKKWPDPAAQADVIAKTLDQLGIKRAHWIGHSWAGSVVLAAALNNASSVASITLLAGASHPWEGGVAWHATLANVPIIGHLFSYTLAAPAGQLMLQDAVAGAFKPEQVPQNYLSNTGVQLSLRPQAFKNNAADLSKLSDWLKSQAQGYAALNVPILLITGEKDTVVPDWNHAQRLVESQPTAQWVRLQGAGHALHHTQTEAVAALIDQFILD